MLSTGQQGERLMFGYQKMGDFLMADIFMHNKMTDEAKVDFILEKGTRREYASYRRFIIALLSEWELTPQLLERKIAAKMYHLILLKLVIIKTLIMPTLDVKSIVKYLIKYLKREWEFTYMETVEQEKHI